MSSPRKYVLAVLLAFFTCAVVSGGRDDKPRERLIRRGPLDYFGIQTLTDSWVNFSGSVSSATEMVKIIGESEEFKKLLVELPDLMNELKKLDAEQIKNIMWLFQIYKNLPAPLVKFFHAVISRTKKIIPTLKDLATFNIASELSVYVDTITNPISNTFSKISKYLPKLYRRDATPPKKLTNDVKNIVQKNVPKSIPQVMANMLVKSLVQLSKAYIGANSPSTSSLPGLKWVPLSSLIG